MRADPEAIREWLVLLHGGSTGLIHLCGTGDWTGRRFAEDVWGAALAYAIERDAAGQAGTYLRVTTLVPDAPADHGKRAGAAFSSSLPGLWADIDIAGPGHKHTPNHPNLPGYDPKKIVQFPLPPDETAARNIVEDSLLLKPTMWIHSGGGLYPWWLLDEPWQMAGNPKALEAATALSEGWQKALEAAARRLNLDYGNVGDLARVMRIPGTINRKEGLERPCRIIEHNGPTYSIRDLAECLVSLQAQSPPPAPVPVPVRPAPHLPGVLRSPAPPAGPRQGSPLDAFEVAMPWEAILLPHGWQVHHVSAGTTYWTRPGKARGEGHSATTGHSTDGRDRMWVFSTACGFPVDEPLTKPYVWGLLNGHGTDMKRVAKALVSSGFGTPVSLSAKTTQLTANPAPATPPPSPQVTNITTDPRGVAGLTAPMTSTSGPVAFPGTAAAPTYNPVVPDQGGWYPAPTRPGEAGTLPPFPVHALPRDMAALVTEVAGSKQVDPIMPALFALATLSAVAGNRAWIRRSGDWQEPLSIYVCPVADSGERKSPVGRAVFGTISNIEARMAAAWSAEVDATVDALVQERAAVGANPSLANRVEDKIVKAEASRKRPPRIKLADDITPEALVRSLSGLGGHGAILDPEGTFMGVLSGRYSSGVPNPELFIKAYDGDQYTADRISRDPDRIGRPTLAIGLAVQRIVLEDAMTNRILLERGALARMIFGFPQSLVGTRFEATAAPHDPTPGRIWSLILDGIAELPTLDPDTEPRCLALSPEALAEHIALADAIERRLGPNGDLTQSGIKEWSHKQAGRVLRIAGLLHLAAGFLPSDEVGIEAMRSAIVIGEWAIEHARHAYRFDKQVLDEANVKQCCQVLDWLARTRQQHVTVRDACRGVRAQWVASKPMEDALDQLAELGWVRPETYLDKAGRLRSRFAVSPYITTAPGPATMSPGMP